MQPGRKAEPADTKLARATWRNDRDEGKVQIVTAGDPPMMPDYLTPEAEIVWQETIGRVMAVGVAEVDSGILARYCAMEALARNSLRQGLALPAAIMTALRQYEELLRIAGPKSRLGVRQDGKPANPFSRNGRR